MIRIAHPEIGPEEIAAVNEVLKSGTLAQGQQVSRLEKDFAEYCGVKHAIAVSSGTAALHAALYAAGVGPGDEVITVPFSFIATVNPILMLGARPVFVDVDPVTFNMDVSQVEAAITPKTKAILPVHLYGQPVNWDELSVVADRHGAKIIEDACQAVAAEYKGKKTGSLGDLGCFSLYATKNMMCGEGGIVTTNSEEYAAAIRRFRQHGMSGAYVYEELGYNYRLTDLQAAIAVEQLKKINRFTAARQENARSLDAGLSGIRGLALPARAADRTHVFHQYTLLVQDDFSVSRDKFVQELQARAIGAGIYYPRALHTYPHIAELGYRVGDFPVAEESASRVVSLPIHPALTSDDIETIINTVREIADV